MELIELILVGLVVFHISHVPHRFSIEVVAVGHPMMSIENIVVSNDSVGKEISLSLKESFPQFLIQWFQAHGVGMNFSAGCSDSITSRLNCVNLGIIWSLTCRDVFSGDNNSDVASDAFTNVLESDINDHWISDVSLPDYRGYSHPSTFGDPKGLSASINGFFCEPKLPIGRIRQNSVKDHQEESENNDRIVYEPLPKGFLLFCLVLFIWVVCGLWMLDYLLGRG